MFRTLKVVFGTFGSLSLQRDYFYYQKALYQSYICVCRGRRELTNNRNDYIIVQVKEKIYLF